MFLWFGSFILVCDIAPCSQWAFLFRIMLYICSPQVADKNLLR